MTGLGREIRIWPYYGPAEISGPEISRFDQKLRFSTKIPLKMTYAPIWAKMSFSSPKAFKNSSNLKYFLTFRQRCSLRSFWVCGRARAPSGSEKRSRWKLSQNWPKFRKMSFWFQIVVKKWFWFYKIILQVILIIYNASLGTFRYQKFGRGPPP